VVFHAVDSKYPVLLSMVSLACLRPSLAPSSRVSILYASSPVFPLRCVRDVISISSSSAGRLNFPDSAEYSIHPSLANIVSTSTRPDVIAKSGVIMEPRNDGGNGLMPSGIPHRYRWTSILLTHHLSTSNGSGLPQSPNLLQRPITRGQVQWRGESSLGFHEPSRHDIPPTQRYRRGSYRPAGTVCQTASRRTMDKHMRKLYLVMQN
jgi:hypothetical protein